MSRILTLAALTLLLSLPLAAQTNVDDNRAMNHVFAQMVDGKFPDGTSYRSTIMLTTDAEAAGCTWKFYGLTVSGFMFRPDGTGLDLAISPYHVFRLQTPGTQSFKSGYSTLTCNTPVTAQVIYSYLSESGKVLSEATVFSSPPATFAQIVLDVKPGTYLGIALVNDSDMPKAYYVVVQTGMQTIVTVPARGRISGFLNEWIPSLPPSYFGAVGIYATNPTFRDDVYAIGLRYTGTAFTTLPATSINY